MPVLPEPVYHEQDEGDTGHDSAEEREHPDHPVAVDVVVNTQVDAVKREKGINDYGTGDVDIDISFVDMKPFQSVHRHSLH